jgi:hypothetical protein
MTRDAQWPEYEGCSGHRPDAGPRAVVPALAESMPIAGKRGVRAPRQQVLGVGLRLTSRA